MGIEEARERNGCAEPILRAPGSSSKEHPFATMQGDGLVLVQKHHEVSKRCPIGGEIACGKGNQRQVARGCPKGVQ